jgi:hypothetical protein
MQVEGLNPKSYSTLSSAGRFKVVVLIRNTAEEAWLCGKDLLRGLERAYRELELAQYQQLVEIGTLRTRMKALEARIEAAKAALISWLLDQGPVSSVSSNLGQDPKIDCHMRACDGHGHETHYFQSFVAGRYSKNAPPIATRLNPMGRYTGWAGSFCKSADTVM